MLTFRLLHICISLLTIAALVANHSSNNVHKPCLFATFFLTSEQVLAGCQNQLFLFRSACRQSSIKFHILFTSFIRFVSPNGEDDFVFGAFCTTTFLNNLLLCDNGVGMAKSSNASHGQRTVTPINNN